MFYFIEDEPGEGMEDEPVKMDEEAEEESTDGDS